MFYISQYIVHRGYKICFISVRIILGDINVLYQVLLFEI